MNIRFSNGAELAPILITGSQKYVQGQSRDTLAFVFPDTAGMEELDTTFSAANCESIAVLGDDAAENIHTGYVIRAALTKELMEVIPATQSTPAVYENRIKVEMSQRTYAESLMASLTDTVDTLVLESLMGGN